MPLGYYTHVYYQAPRCGIFFTPLTPQLGPEKRLISPLLSRSKLLVFQAHNLCTFRSTRHRAHDRAAGNTYAASSETTCESSASQGSLCIGAFYQKPGPSAGKVDPTGCETEHGSGPCNAPDPDCELDWNSQLSHSGRFHLGGIRNGKGFPSIGDLQRKLN